MRFENLTVEQQAVLEQWVRQMKTIAVLQKHGPSIAFYKYCEAWLIATEPNEEIRTFFLDVLQDEIIYNGAEK